MSSSSNAAAIARHRLDSPRRGGDFPVALAGVGTVAGIAALGLVGSISPLGLVVGAAGLVLGGVISIRPEVGVLLLLVSVAIVPGNVLEAWSIPLAGGGIKFTDLLVGFSLCAWLVSLVVVGHRPQLPSPLVSYLLLSFLGLAGASLVTARASGIPLKQSLTELRPLLAYLIVFPIVGCVHRRRTLLTAATVVLAALGISSLVTLGRYASGTHELALGTGGALRIRDTTDLAPLLAFVCGVVLVCLWRPARSRALPFLLALVGLAALYITFLRGAWLAAALALGVIMVLLPGRLRRWIALRSTILVLCSAVTIFATRTLLSTNSHPASAGAARVATLFHSDQDVSAQHRLAEWREATREISAHPLVGMGLGATITFVSPMYNDVEQASGVHFTTSYIHNSYLWLALKLGIPAAAAFVAATFYALSSAILLYRKRRNIRDRQILLAVAGSLIATLGFAATGPHLTALNSTPLIAALVAVPELIRRFGDEDA